MGHKTGGGGVASVVVSCLVLGSSVVVLQYGVLCISFKNPPAPHPGRLAIVLAESKEGDSRVVHKVSQEGSGVGVVISRLIALLGVFHTPSLTPGHCDGRGGAGDGAPVCHH